MFLMLIMLNTKTYARGIEGLDQQQVDDFNLCLNQQGFSFDQVNQWENSAYMISQTPDQTLIQDRSNSHSQSPSQNSETDEWPLYHNFKIFKEYINLRGEKTFSNAIIASGIFYVSGEHSFENSIIANTTFVGDLGKLNFKNTCLVNVKFHNASFLTLLKIKRSSSFYKNVTD